MLLDFVVHAYAILIITLQEVDSFINRRRLLSEKAFTGTSSRMRAEADVCDCDAIVPRVACQFISSTSVLDATRRLVAFSRIILQIIRRDREKSQMYSTRSYHERNIRYVCLLHFFIAILNGRCGCERVLRKFSIWSTMSYNWSKFFLHSCKIFFYIISKIYDTDYFCSSNLLK